MMNNTDALSDTVGLNHSINSQINLYAIFHLNLMYSSIEEEQRPEVIERCYWPLLRIIREYRLPFGIEASGHTLETIAQIDQTWIDELRSLVHEDICEFIGSGYAQIIGPLVPAEVNAANLNLGHKTYEKLLGVRPQVALVNEQAYSAGLIQHYLDAGYRAIIMEWDNPAHHHPEWNQELCYLPQVACGQHGEEIALIWNMSIAFQKFQRYVHGEMELDEYLDYLSKHLRGIERAFCLYGNDIEVFDFRPGRYHTEANIYADEWLRIAESLSALLADNRFSFIHPRQVLDLMKTAGAGNRLRLESSQEPIPVKKQGKYNITRWAVTGRDDIGINTACWQIYRAIKSNPALNESEWRELCYLWSSDFRTHITEKRWETYRKRLADVKRKLGIDDSKPSASFTMYREDTVASNGQNTLSEVVYEGRYISVETEALKVHLNRQRGLAIDNLWFKGISGQPLVGTLQHGFYEDISLGADFYTGHLVFEAPGQPKVTDLSPVEPVVKNFGCTIDVVGAVSTPLGPIHKHVRIFKDIPRIELEYRLDWEAMPIGSLRLGHITLNPEVFERDTLSYSTHNGGFEKEVFGFLEPSIEHGRAVSFLVSSNQAVGVTGDFVEFGDAQHRLVIEIDKSAAALVGMVTYKEVSDSYFCRLSLSAIEVDETSKELDLARTNLQFRVSIGMSEPKRGASKNDKDSGVRY